MKWRTAFILLLIAFLVVNCSKTKELAADRSRLMSPDEITSFHTDVSVTIGWIPYQDTKLVQTGNNEWKIMKREEVSEKGASPVIVVTYADSEDTILLDMNIKNELLGKLIKHSVMTQEPIKRPFTTFFDEAKCQKCHPSHIEVDFNN